MAIRDYAQYDGIGLAELVAKKKVKPIELLDEAITRAEALNPKLNAIIYKDYDRAREAAKAPHTFVANLAWAAALAQPAGVELLIEPINPRDMPGYFLNRQDEAHAIVDEVGNPALKVQMDLYHCQIVEGDVSMKLRKYLAEKSVGHIQIASVPARNEPDHGELNYDYVLDLIDELGFDGWIGCEYRPKGGTSEGLTWLKRRL